MAQATVRTVVRESDKHAELVEEYPMAAGTIADPRCREMAGGDWECTRPKGHSGIHVGHHNATWIGAYWVRTD